MRTIELVVPAGRGVMEARRAARAKAEVHGFVVSRVGRVTRNEESGRPGTYSVKVEVR